MATEDEKKTSSLDYDDLRRRDDVCKNNQREAFNLLSSLGEIWESITNIKTRLTNLESAREQDLIFQEETKNKLTKIGDIQKEHIETINKTFLEPRKTFIKWRDRALWGFAAVGVVGIIGVMTGADLKQMMGIIKIVLPIVN